MRLTFVMLACMGAMTARADECSAPARSAEQQFDLPPGLLFAIGQAESGRRLADGTTEPWPWSVNAAGRGYFLPDAAQAVALVETLRRQGIQSIDVGCFQVNLLHHPEAFATVQEAFRPARNAMEAARFLRTLQDRAGRWEDAVAHYHSTTPELGLPYMRQVWARWLGTAPPAAPMLSRVAALVRVIVPGAPRAEHLLPGGPRLPVVYTPSRLN